MAVDANKKEVASHYVTTFLNKEEFAGRATQQYAINLLMVVIDSHSFCPPQQMHHFLLTIGIQHHTKYNQLAADC